MAVLHQMVTTFLISFKRKDVIIHYYQKILVSDLVPGTVTLLVVL